MNLRHDEIDLNGAKFEGCSVDIFGKNLAIIKAPKGFVSCGYIDMRAAEKFGQALAIVRGVKNYGDMLAATVEEISSAARALGVDDGMTGKDALEKML